jgi:hypothetical protein
MAVANRSDRAAEEAESLLNNENGDHSHLQPGGNSKDTVWVHYSWYVVQATRETLRTNFIYVLLVFVPLGFAARIFNWHPVAISVFNFLAIIPLSALVSSSSDDLSHYLGELVGGLINATFGNAVELSVCHP